MHVAITGASSGIGEAIAREFAKAGAKLTLVARRKELLDKLNQETGGNAFVYAQDLADPTRALEWLAPAEAANGPVDVLINNAGMENTGVTARSDPQEGVKLLNLNLVTPLLITRAVLPRMLERKAGTIVQVASVSALAAPPGQAWYGASKAGLAMFTETLRYELDKTGVHVVAVYPGPVKTAMADAAIDKFGGAKTSAAKVPMGTPDELAKLVRRAVEKKQARVVYPWTYSFTYWMPWLGRVIVDSFSPRPKA